MFGQTTILYNFYSSLLWNKRLLEKDKLLKYSDNMYLKLFKKNLESKKNITVIFFSGLFS